jgi:hypothetical protein
MKKIFFFAFSLCFFLIAGLLVSCGRKVTAPAATIKETQKDSVNVTVKDRDVPFFIEGEKVYDTIYVRCDSVTNKPIPVKIKSKNGRAFNETSIDKNGKLTTVGGCDSLTALIKAKDSLLYHFKSFTHEEVKPQIIYKTRTIDIWCRWLAVAFIILLLLKLKSFLS